MQDDHVGVLLEDIQGKLQGLAEVVHVMQQDIAEMKPQLAQITENTTDLRTTRAVVTDHSQQLDDHESRLHVLEMPQRA